MKISDTNQSQNIYDLDLASSQGKGNKTTEVKKVQENVPAAEISISKEGLAAWEEAVKNKSGCFGVVTGRDAPSEISRQDPKYEVYFEHLWELGAAMDEVEKKYDDQGDGVNYFMLTLAEAYEVVYNKIVEQHKDGNREVTYEIAGECSLSLEEDLAGLDEAYDYWLKFVDAHVFIQQRWKALLSHDTDAGLSKEEHRQKTEQRVAADEYRHNVIDIMRRGREDFLATFRSLNENKGIMAGIMNRLMGLSPGFWEMTNKLWP